MADGRTSDVCRCMADELLGPVVEAADEWAEVALVAGDRDEPNRSRGQSGGSWFRGSADGWFLAPLRSPETMARSQACSGQRRGGIRIADPAGPAAGDSQPREEDQLAADMDETALRRVMTGQHTVEATDVWNVRRLSDVDRVGHVGRGQESTRVGDEGTDDPVLGDDANRLRERDQRSEAHHSPARRPAGSTLAMRSGARTGRPVGAGGRSAPGATTPRRRSSGTSMPHTRTARRKREPRCWMSTSGSFLRARPTRSSRSIRPTSAS
jgi:hypothetical protein